MNQNRLGIASIVLVALVGATVWQLNSREAEDKVTPTATVEVPSLKADDIQELTFTAPEKPTVTVVRKGDGWQLTAPVQAKADDNAIKTALTKLEELEVTGVAATKEKNHGKLEVDGETGSRVTVKGAGKTLLDGWVGVYRSGNSMFRLEGDEKVATVKGSIRYAFSKEVREWRDRTITKVETDSVQEMKLVNPKGEFHFKREGDTWAQVGGKKVEPLDESKVKGIVGSGASLNATDFAATDVTAEAAGLGEDAPTFTLVLGGDAGPSEITYRLGGPAEKNFYLQKVGDDEIFIVSSWVHGRLTAGEDVLKKEAPPDPNQPRLGSPENPIRVEPTKVE
ncbi:MAG: DUF4340 domain-containing protein, partial [Myxococcales bacterium]|nr:DUF4340 domain-containing protein [Myxococcales bacterium]